MATAALLSSTLLKYCVSYSYCCLPKETLNLQNNTGTCTQNLHDAETLWYADLWVLYMRFADLTS
jgi:hypothetical protein